ncbi:hypothetical protein CVU83_00430 [Candidatus Falkowbacteria bacterium HGW-Falkowbacteria-2]|uniref:3D domain-containing protein n=1 Tax=Candidatus Falkowbacteria bacterium HGW-Falkowbacteria-2 TaxID=2013769 RepID=A0A2N2E3H5_9BACT|nr:MAG: hypothetical protein CVU83_00430 [Candidatus Falkowbacteria bacterium HGW-Falkowbacteria-2]
MKIIKMSEDLVPLSRRQREVLGLIVVCVFQFMFFFAPVLAAEAVAKEDVVKIGVMNKSAASPIVAALIEGAQSQSETALELPYVGIKPEPAPELLEIEEPAKKEPEYRVVRTSTHSMTAYNSLAAQTDSTPCITANNFNVCEHGIEDTVAANFLKFGTKIRIPELFGDRVFVVRDRMNKRYTDRVDIWMLEYSDARKFGVKRATIEVLEEVE